MDRKVESISMQDFLRQISMTEGPDAGEIQLSYTITDVAVNVRGDSCAALQVFRKLPKEWQMALVKRILERLSQEGGFAVLAEDVFSGEVLYITRIKEDGENITLFITH